MSPGARLTLATATSRPLIEQGLRLQLLWPDLMLAQVVLDGCNLLALVGTGGSLINTRGLYRVGLTPERLERDRIVSLEVVGGRLPARLHGFRQLRLGSVTILKPEIVVSSVPEAGFDMILGMDIVRQQILCLSDTELKMEFGGT
jgi:hypothetical protein